MTEPELKQEREKLEADKTRLERERLEFERKKKDESLFVKHFGSIFAATIALVAALISGTQAYVAYGQRRLAEAQTVEKFIPHLLKPESRDLALAAMSPFVEASLVTNLAGKFKATPTLEIISLQGPPAEQEAAKRKLDELSQARLSLIASMFSTDKQARIAATTKLAKEWTADPRMISEALAYAVGNMGNEDGIYNTVVLFQSAALPALRAQGEDLVKFLQAAKTKGPQTAEQVKRLENRLSGSSSDFS